MAAKGAPVFTFSLPGERLAPLPSVSYATACSLKKTFELYFGIHRVIKRQASKHRNLLLTTLL